MDWRFDGLTALVSIAAGKAADLVVLAGNRAKNIDDVERVETVFKDCVDDPGKLIAFGRRTDGVALTEGAPPLNSGIVRRP